MNQLLLFPEDELCMSDDEKGYHCPHNPEKNIDCFNCPFRASKCIVYSVAGKRKLREWKIKNNIPLWA